MLAYAGFIAIYNLIFDQNILDLRFPSIEIMKLFGPWPYYVIVNIALALLWYYIIHMITMRIKIVKIT